MGIATADDDLARTGTVATASRSVSAGLDQASRTDSHADNRRSGPHDQVRTIHTVFVDAVHGYRAVDRLRERGFRIDLAVSIGGDLIVSVQADQTQTDEVVALVRAHHGRVDRAGRSSAA